MLNLFLGKKESVKLDVNLMMVEILKTGKSFDRNEIKMEIFKYRFKYLNGFDFVEKDYLDGKYSKEMINELMIKSRNGFDSWISKNNRENVLKGFEGFEDKKVVCLNGKYLIK